MQKEFHFHNVTPQMFADAVANLKSEFNITETNNESGNGHMRGLVHLTYNYSQVKKYLNVNVNWPKWIFSENHIHQNLIAALSGEDGEASSEWSKNEVTDNTSSQDGFAGEVENADTIESVDQLKEQTQVDEQPVTQTGPQIKVKEPSKKADVQQSDTPPEGGNNPEAQQTQQSAAL